MSGAIVPRALVTYDLYNYSLIGGMIVSAGICSCNKNVACFSAAPTVATLAIGGSTDFGNAAGVASIANVNAAIAYFSALPPGTEIAGDLISLTFVPGVYHAGAAITNTGTITFDALDQADATFVFQIGAAFASAAASSMQLKNGATSDMIFWIVVGAVSTGALSHIEGSVLCSGAVSFGAGAGINGRVLGVGTVSLSSSVVVTSIVAPVPTPTPTPAPTPPPTPVPTATPTPTPTPVPPTPTPTPVPPTPTPTPTPTPVPPTPTPTPVPAHSTNALAAFNLDTCSLVGNVIGVVGTSYCNRDVACVVPAATIPSLTVGGSSYLGDAFGAASATYLAAAISHYAQLTPTEVISGDIAGRTFLPGVYHCGAALTNTGVLTLDANNDGAAAFVFQIVGAFATAAGSTMQMNNGVTSDMVFWAITGAIVTGAQTRLEGSVMNVGAVTFGADTRVNGRVLSIGAVSIASSVITTLLDPVPTPTPTPLPTATPTPTPLPPTPTPLPPTPTPLPTSTPTPTPVPPTPTPLPTATPTPTPTPAAAPSPTLTPVQSNVSYIGTRGLRLYDENSSEILNIFKGSSNVTCIYSPSSTLVLSGGDSNASTSVSVTGNLDVTHNLHVGGVFTLSCEFDPDMWFQFCISTTNQLILNKIQRSALGIVVVKKIAEFGDLKR